MSSESKPNSTPTKENTEDIDIKIDGSVAPVGIDNKGKSIDQLKFYPDNPTHFSHKAKFAAYVPVYSCCKI